MTAKKKHHGVNLSVECLESRQLLAAALTAPSVLSKETFDTTLPGLLPKGWSQWSKPGSFGAAAGRGSNRTNGVSSDGVSSQISRSWYNAAQPADMRASANVFLDGTRLIPGQVLVRGTGLDSGTPTYYAASVTRGMDLELIRVVNGQSTVLARLRSSTARYISNQWVRVTLEARGANLSVNVQRLDTNEWLNAAGNWQGTTTTALRFTDARTTSNPLAITSGGYAGLNRPAGYPGQVFFDEFSVTNLATNATASQSFNSTPSTTMPNDWSQWTNDGTFAVSTAKPLSSTGGLMAEGEKRAIARVWMDTPAPANSSASASIFLNNLAGASVFIRGKNLSSSTPTYYAATVTKGLRVELTRTVNGSTTTLGRPVQSISSRYISNKWARVTLNGEGNKISVQVQRLDTGEYLTSTGNWQTAQTSAITVADSVTLGAGQAGVARGNQAYDDIAFDDFQVTAVATQPMTVNISSPTNNTLINRATTAQVAVNSPYPVTGIEYYVDNVRQTTTSPASTTFLIDPKNYTDGPHTLSVVVYNNAGNIGRSSVNFTSSTAITSVPSTSIPKHYSHIRIAQLAYSGTPIGSFEENLLRSSVDLVVANEAYLAEMEAVSPNTPKLIYSNVSGLYRELLTDWLNYSDARRVNREGAFYHASVPTPFAGNSSSSQPVNWFWSVQRGGVTTGFEDYTAVARTPQRAVEFGGAGSSMYVGFTDMFREINVSLSRGASAGWSTIVEYPTAVNSAGQPTSWRPLRLLSDGTVGLTRSGQIQFDPSANLGWVPAKIGNSDADLYYVRFRTLTNGSAPIGNTILGRDYVNARGSTSGTIPVFDKAADRNGDNYLDNAEYAARSAGKDARFFYESRVFQSPYGQMRFATVPGYQPLRDWAVDYHKRLLARNPYADGLFMDNSSGKPPVEDGKVLESVANYGEDFGALLNQLGRGIGPKFVMPNTSGGGLASDPVIRQNTGYFEEFVIRAQAHTYQQFEDLALILAHRNTLRSTPAYTVLDSLPTGGSPTDPRTQIATLAYYYLLQDPNTTFLDFFGGYEPATTWSRHWSQAAAYNVGTPTGGWSLRASGVDPGNRALNYRVYQRSYTNALVLYKPLSYSQSAQRAGSLGSETATVHQLNGTYRMLQANGTLSAPVTSVALKNGEGAILIRV